MSTAEPKGTTSRSDKEKIASLTLEKDNAQATIAQTKFLFEEAIKQTERFWSHFRWITGLVATTIALAIGFQVYQSTSRLSDAVSNADKDVKSLLSQTNERIIALESRANDDIKRAISKLFDANITSVNVLNSTDSTDRLVGYAHYVIQHANNVPYGVDINLVLRVRVGFEGTGTAEIAGIHYVGDADLLSSIYGNEVSLERDVLSAGTIARAQSFAALPHYLYALDIEITRRVRNCAEYEELLRALTSSDRIGRLSVTPMYKEAPNTPRDFSVQIRRQPVQACQEVWDAANSTLLQAPG